MLFDADVFTMPPDCRCRCRYLRRYAVCHQAIHNADADARLMLITLIFI